MIYIDSKIKVASFGNTHDEEVGALIMGFPEDFEIDMDDVKDFLERRRPGSSDLVSQRNEADEPIITEGIKDGKTTGDAIRVVFKNADVKGKEKDSDYIPRPGHGDITYYWNTGEFLKGATSARSTVGLTFAGALAKQFLSERGIFVNAKLVSPDEKEIKKAAKEGDSIGGIVEGNIIGLPKGFGNPYSEKIESRLARVLFNLPGVKGVDFGLGFELSNMKGSEANDEFYIDDGGEVRTKTNNCGGILGGMATGNTVVFHAFFKPTPSIAKEQKSVNLQTNEEVSVKSEGRNDPCIAVRGAAVVEAAAALAIMDMVLE